MRHTLLALVSSAALVAAGCGSTTDPPAPPAAPDPLAGDAGPNARAQLAARAAAAKDLVAFSVYTLAAPDREDRTITVVRAADGGWRVDVPGGALGGTVDVSLIRTDAGMFQCVLGNDASPTCVRVDQLTADIDPVVPHVFTDWLDVLTDRAAPLSVSGVPAPPDGVDGDCFAVEPSAASLVAPLDAGVYCYDPSGLLTSAQLGFGTLTLRSTDRTGIASVPLPGPVRQGDPLPTASPPPAPTPSSSGY